MSVLFVYRFPLSLYKKTINNTTTLQSDENGDGTDPAEEDSSDDWLERLIIYFSV